MTREEQNEESIRSEPNAASNTISESDDDKIEEISKKAAEKALDVITADNETNSADVNSRKATNKSCKTVHEQPQDGETSSMLCRATVSDSQVDDLGVKIGSIDLSQNENPTGKKVRDEPKAPRGKSTLGGKLCHHMYLNDIRCTEIPEDGNVCDLHRKGEPRKVYCTSFTKSGEVCRNESKTEKYSKQEEWSYVCPRHTKALLQRGHRYRSGMPDSLLAGVNVSPTIFLEEDLCFVISERDEVIITAAKFNALTRTKKEICELFDLTISPWMNVVKDWENRFYDDLKRINDHGSVN
ncbi:hypothetical protein BGZ83_006382 [Gryganskiella cystojenkinii]|nr:hypothetical protein BGZ83_006382 [Gryganskiella cystojenkinii]